MRYGRLVLALTGMTLVTIGIAALQANWRRPGPLTVSVLLLVLPFVLLFALLLAVDPPEIDSDSAASSKEKELLTVDVNSYSPDAAGNGSALVTV